MPEEAHFSLDACLARLYFGEFLCELGYAIHCGCGRGSGLLRGGSWLLCVSSGWGREVLLIVCKVERVVVGVMLADLKSCGRWSLLLQMVDRRGFRGGEVGNACGSSSMSCGCCCRCKELFE